MNVTSLSMEAWAAIIDALREGRAAGRAGETLCPRGGCFGRMVWGKCLRCHR